jgi:hypothetical protein
MLAKTFANRMSLPTSLDVNAAVALVKVGDPPVSAPSVKMPRPGSPPGTGMRAWKLEAATSGTVGFARSIT